MDKILVIDGFAGNLDLLRERLSYFNYSVLTADRGIAGFTKAKLFNPDLIIMSTELPDMSGFDLCKRLKETEETKYILILFISNLETKDSNIRAIEVGADDIIEKNSDSIVLISKVKSLLRVKHLILQLGDKYAELEEKDKILNQQLKMGRHIQKALIKEVDFAVDGLEFYSKYMPALDVGGDFYNIIQLNEDCYGVIIGDVSGHGIGAALLTSMLSLMFNNLSAKNFNPDALLHSMNNQFYNIFYKDNAENETGMYASVFYAVFDTKNKKIYYSNAGHPLPIYASAEEAVELDSSGMPLGIMPDSEYEFKEMDYKSGDMLLFHTDGLSDNLYKEDSEEFSEKVKELMFEARTVETSEEIINLLLSTFYKYNPTVSEKFEFDDVSLILCRM